MASISDALVGGEDAVEIKLTHKNNRYVQIGEITPIAAIELDFEGLGVSGTDPTGTVKVKPTNCEEVSTFTAVNSVTKDGGSYVVGDAVTTFAPSEKDEYYQITFTATASAGCTFKNIDLSNLDTAVTQKSDGTNGALEKVVSAAAGNNGTVVVTIIVKTLGAA